MTNNQNQASAWLCGGHSFTDYAKAVRFAQGNMYEIEPLYKHPAQQTEAPKDGSEKDAERYRWWRNYFDTMDVEMPEQVVEARNAQELDAAIDAAIAKEKANG